ncbi:MAG: hypothetical protein LQ341_004301, partial [Variospora aurantia]
MSYYGKKKEYFLVSFMTEAFAAKKGFPQQTRKIEPSQKIGLDEQLRASGVRSVLSAAIEISQDPMFAPDTVVHSVSAVPQGISPFKPTMALDDRVTRHKIHANHESKLVVTPRNKPEGLEPLPAETIDEVAGWVRRYPNIQSEEKDQLMEIVSLLADNNAQKYKPVKRVRAEAYHAFQ